MNDFDRNIDDVIRNLGIGDLSDGEGQRSIRAGELEEIVSGINGGFVNCYPGTPGVGCAQLAYFFSLKGKKIAKGRGHLTCAQALKELVKHLTGTCMGITTRAVFIADNWDPDAFNEWRATINNLQGKCRIEFYLIVNRQQVRLPI